MSMSTGNQIKAARVLAEVDQVTLANEAGVHVNTIRGMEARGGQTLVAGVDTALKVQRALEARGVEFLNHGQPGVRLKSAKPALAE